MNQLRIFFHPLYDDLVEKIRQISLKVDGIADTEKCFVRKSGIKYHIDLHIVVDADISVKQGHELAHKFKNILQKEIPDLGQILMHIEPTNLEK